MEDLISVIVPAYNIELYLEKAVKSICSQTYSNLEIILVDDGSTDNTSIIMDRLAMIDSRIKVIHKKNGGVTSARLTGVENSSGKWIGFVDGDDFIEPEMYECLLKNARLYHADISHCGYQMVFPSRVDYYYNTGKIWEQDHMSGLADLISGRQIEPGLCNKLYRKELFQELLSSDVMDTSIKNTEDFLMNFYLFQNAEKSVFEDFCPYHYVLRPGSAATENINENKLRDPLMVFRIIEQYVKDIPELHRIILDRIVTFLINQATMGFDNQKDLIKPFRIAARKELRRILRFYLSESNSKKRKIMAVWASVWPASYRWIHKLYARMKGTKDKYYIR